jgi:hypothetical protein
MDRLRGGWRVKPHDIVGVFVVVLIAFAASEGMYEAVGARFVTGLFGVGFAFAAYRYRGEPDGLGERAFITLAGVASVLSTAVAGVLLWLVIVPFAMYSLYKRVRK